LQQHLARGLTPTGPPITNFYAVHGHPQPGGYLQEAPVQPLMLHPQVLFSIPFGDSIVFAILYF